MTMEETIAYVNDKLKKGYSIAKVERELKFGKDTLRKKLNRTGYMYNKNLNQFILDDNTNTTQHITYAEKNNITKPITQHITHTEKQSITQSNNTHVTQPSPRAFTDEDFNILFELIDNYKAKKKTIVIPKNDSEITTRSFRSYKNVFDSFSEYCKNNNLNQKDAIAEALISYISK